MNYFSNINSEIDKKVNKTLKNVYFLEFFYPREIKNYKFSMWVKVSILKDLKMKNLKFHGTYDQIMDSGERSKLTQRRRRGHGDYAAASLPVYRPPLNRHRLPAEKIVIVLPPFSWYYLVLHTAAY